MFSFTFTRNLFFVEAGSISLGCFAGLFRCCVYRFGIGAPTPPAANLWLVEAHCVLVPSGCKETNCGHSRWRTLASISRRFNKRAFFWRGWNNQSHKHTYSWYCWWFRNPANQLRLVIFPIIHKVLYIPGGAGFLPSINSRGPLCMYSITNHCCSSQLWDRPTGIGFFHTLNWIDGPKTMKCGCFFFQLAMILFMFSCSILKSYI